MQSLNKNGVSITLDECRRRRDEWVAKKNGVINK